MNSIPQLKSKNEMLAVLEQQAYGKMPGKYGETVCRTVNTPYETAAGKGRVENIEITADTGNGLFTFPVRLIRNMTMDISPVIILINFRRDLYDSYCPAEEILDNGFSLIQVYFEDITSDDEAGDNGLAHYFPKNEPDSPGKIALWAWALSRTIDAAEKDTGLDRSNIAVIGHSRLGKTALLCAAFDERVKYVHSNDSGCMGASLEYGKHDNAEDRNSISQTFPWWFCNRFNDNATAGMIDESFDQHFLLACIAPRFVCVASSEDDLWADPENEFACCMAASGAWNKYNLSGFICNDEKAETGKEYLRGSIAYRIRKGRHYLSREDWLYFMRFIKAKG